MSSGADLNSIIVADDQSAWRDLLRSLLSREGFQVLLVRDGQEAVELACSMLAKLVLLDVRMPHLDGLEACASIRALPSYAAIPIVILSGYDNERIRETASRAGATRFLTKPISSLELKQAIFPLLGVDPAIRMAYVEWKRRPEPTPAYGEKSEFAYGRRVLDICRRSVRQSGGADWFH